MLSNVNVFLHLPMLTLPQCKTAGFLNDKNSIEGYLPRGCVIPIINHLMIVEYSIAANDKNLLKR